ncbi:MAG: hypothetical protein DHS20C08_20500 [Rhodomicrobium sp.]|nr:MAG: hypothetical protein DHS20C08_20500 [Rhodomicrobium sp.]
MLKSYATVYAAIMAIYLILNGIWFGVMAQSGDQIVLSGLM